MGGSGGNFNPPRVRSEIRDLEKTVEDADYQANVSHFLANTLASANDRNVEVVQGHLDSIKGAIEKEIGGFVDLLFGGSVSKNTYVEGVSDVDALVVLNDSELATKSPREVQEYLISQLQKRLPDTKVEADGFAVAVRYSDGDVELVPVKKQGDAYLLPNADSETWTRVRPRAFTNALTSANREQNGKLIPTIKLAKVALTDLPEQRRPSGYHLESLALDVFDGYDGPKTPKDMLMHFFSAGAERVLRPITDKTGQSRYVDEYLGPSKSTERQVLSESLGRIARRLKNADGAHSVDQWKRVFGDE